MKNGRSGSLTTPFLCPRQMTTPYFRIQGKWPHPISISKANDHTSFPYPRQMTTPHFHIQDKWLNGTCVLALTMLIQVATRKSLGIRVFNNEFKYYEAKIEESEKAGSCWESNPKMNLDVMKRGSLFQYHLCSTYRGLVVVRLLWLSGRALAAQARGILG